MTREEIHNIYVHMSGKAEGLVEAGAKADFPVMFANAILEYARKRWVGLTDDEIDDLYCEHHDDYGYALSATKYERAIEAKLREKNG